RRLAVHVALDAQLQELGVQVEDARDDAEQLGRALVDDAAVALEEHRLEDDDAISDERGERRRLIGAAVVVGDTVPRLGIERALVEAIDVAVAVGVEVGAALVLAHAGLVGAAIVGVGDAVAVLIGRRAAAELFGAGLGRAGVAGVGDAVGVAVGRRRQRHERRRRRDRPRGRQRDRRAAARGVRDVLDAEDGARAIGRAVATRQADAD